MKRSEYLRNAHDLFREKEIGLATYEAMIDNVDEFTDEPDLEDMTIGELLYYSTYEDSFDSEYLEEVCRRAGMLNKYNEAVMKDFGKKEKTEIDKVVKNAAKQFGYMMV